jgi:hypothetical protein
MKAIKSEKVVLCDIDDTLLLYNSPGFSQFKKKVSVGDIQEVEFTFGENRKGRLHVYLPHVSVLEAYRKNSYTIGIWGQGGFEYCESVILTLIDEMIIDKDLIAFYMSKPEAILDDYNSFREMAINNLHKLI